MVWQIINSGKLSGKENMDFDRRLFSDFEKCLIGPAFRIYGWRKPCISIGYSQTFEDVPEKDGWDIVKRPTGGGICFHKTSEISYSLIAGRDDPVFGGKLMESYFRISEIILECLRKLEVDVRIGQPDSQTTRPPDFKRSLCFDQTRDHEITLNGKKIVGSAQRRGRVGFLQQGTILTDLIGIDREKIIGSLINHFAQRDRVA